MARPIGITMVLVLLCAGGIAQADVLDMGPGLTSLTTVRVRDAGNVADTRYVSTGRGSVDHDYSIGKYEVTAAQYCEFLNNTAKATDPYGLYNASMSSDPKGCQIQRTGSAGSYQYGVASDWANRPVNFVSFWDGCRFANWLNNGQGNSNTETGAYALGGYIGDSGKAITRNPLATWFLPSMDEWYKAAYYRGDGLNTGYWDYPTRSDTAPANQVLLVDPGNSANWWTNGSYTLGSPYYRTNVGEFENSASAYGTYDQGGNVWEWNDSTDISTSFPAYRGDAGCGFENRLSSPRAMYCTSGVPNGEVSDLGFRVAAIPEPSSTMALCFGILSLAGFLRRKS